MVSVIRETDQLRVPEVAKKYGLSVETVYRWRRRLVGGDDRKRLEALEYENATLKEVLAEKVLEIALMKGQSRKA